MIVERDGSGNWCVAVEADAPDLYGTVHSRRYRHRLPVPPTATREQAVEAARGEVARGEVEEVR